MNAVKILIVIVLFVMGAAPAAAATVEGEYLLVKIGSDSCAVTRLSVGSDIAVYQKIFRVGSVTGPAPDRYPRGNEIGEYIADQLFAEADYYTNVDAWSLYAVTYNGSCKIDRFVQKGDQWFLYENIFDSSGDVSGPSPDRITQENMQDILSKATDVWSMHV